MRDCKHLDVTPPQQLTPVLWSGPVALCVLKSDLPTRLTMAKEATDILATVCPPNTECHYYGLDRCDECPSYDT